MPGLRHVITTQNAQAFRDLTNNLTRSATNQTATQAINMARQARHPRFVALTRAMRTR